MNHALLPLTRQTLAEQFATCGLQAGQTLLVHSSMKSLGTYVIGGAQTVIEALLHVLGSGTLMMPTHTTENTEPSRWSEPPVPPAWWAMIRAETPAYDPARTPTRGMGILPELFRTYPGVLRSRHPIGSFAAYGPQAQFLTEHHELSFMFGEQSPLGRLYALDGHVLLLGVPHSNNTSLHLAEYRARYPGRKVIEEGAAMWVNGERCWVVSDDLDPNTEDFDRIGAAFEAHYRLASGKVGQADVRLMRQRLLVDYAVAWMERYRR